MHSCGGDRVILSLNEKKGIQFFRADTMAPEIEMSVRDHADIYMLLY